MIKWSIVITQYKKVEKAFSEKLSKPMLYYYCTGCRNVIKIKMIDNGVIPGNILCEKCGCVARKTHNITNRCRATREWYRPTLPELNRFKLNPKVLKTVLTGGLFERKIKNGTIKNK